MWIIFRAGPSVGMASALVLTGCGSLSGTPELSTSLTTGSAGATAAGATAAMAVINEAYAAFNFGDVERWVAMREPGSHHRSVEHRRVALEELTRWTESQVVAGAQFTQIQCRAHGEGEWPGIADEGMPIAEGHYVTCDALVSPDTVDGGGKVVFDWVIAHGEVVAVTSEGTDGWCVGPPTNAPSGQAVPALPLSWSDVRKRAGFAAQTGVTSTQ